MVPLLQVARARVNKHLGDPMDLFVVVLFHVCADIAISVLFCSTSEIRGTWIFPVVFNAKTLGVWEFDARLRLPREEFPAPRGTRPLRNSGRNERCVCVYSIGAQTDR